MGGKRKEKKEKKETRITERKPLARASEKQLASAGESRDRN